MDTLSTPVVLLIFNRPETTERVFAAIRAARPQRLFVVADGPRPHRPFDIQKCAEVRRIVERIDWSCEVQRNYSDVNIGCRQRVSSGLDWVFSQVETAIILEDDCLPDHTFFRFCQELLEQYRDDDRIMSICGSNPLGGWKSDIQSYHFSFYGGIWGWATWRRAWNCYDVAMSLWKNADIRRRISDVLGGGRLYRHRALEFDRLVSGKVDTWDYQWSFAQLVHEGLTLTSSINLVSNIGFNADATHTVNPNNSFAAIPAASCHFPLKNNEVIEVDQMYDAAQLNKVLAERPWIQKLSDFIRIVT